LPAAAAGRESPRATHGEARPEAALDPVCEQSRRSPFYDAEAIRQDLATGVANPVRWYDTLEVMRELGANLFIEMAPGHVSTHLVAELFPDVRAISIADQGIRYATVLATRERAL